MTEPIPTPRTDDAEYHPIADNYGYVVDADFARSLERELAAKTSECQRLRDALKELRDAVTHRLSDEVTPESALRLHKAHDQARQALTEK